MTSISAALQITQQRPRTKRTLVLAQNSKIQGAKMVWPSAVAGSVRRRMVWILAVFVVLSLVGAVILALKWPFTAQSLTESITEIVPGGVVEISHFQSTVFPHPGCEA